MEEEATYHEDAILSYSPTWNFYPNAFSPSYSQDSDALFSYEDEGKNLHEFFKQFTTVLDDEERNEPVPTCDVMTPDPEFLWVDETQFPPSLLDPFATEKLAGGLDFQECEFPQPEYADTATTTPPAP